MPTIVSSPSSSNDESTIAEMANKRSGPDRKADTEATNAIGVPRKKALGPSAASG